MNMRRILLSATAVAALAAAPATSHAATVGISDQQASTFTNPLFPALKTKHARYVAPYDVMQDGTQHARWNAWYNGALAAGQRILVSFEHSRTHGREQRAPSISEYTKRLKEFKAAYPRVAEINSWNEVTRCQEGSRTEGQPRAICRSPKRVAQYYMAARKVFRGKLIIGLNVLDAPDPRATQTVKFIKGFRRYAKPMPTVWGLQNYSDTNRFSTRRTSAIIRAFGKGRVWLLETGGQLQLGTRISGEAKAAKALGCMFYIAKKFRSKIQRLYVYQFNGLPPMASKFDAGLINPDNTPRAGYEIVRKRKSRTCRP